AARSAELEWPRRRRPRPPRGARRLGRRRRARALVTTPRTGRRPLQLAGARRAARPLGIPRPLAVGIRPRHRRGGYRDAGPCAARARRALGRGGAYRRRAARKADDAVGGAERL